MLNTSIRRALAAVGSVAVATVGLAAVAPAAHAEPVNLKFNCSASSVQNQEFVLEADVTVPTTVEQLKSVKVSMQGTVTAPPIVRGAAYAILGLRKIGGTADVKGTFGADAVSMKAAVAQTEISGTTGDSLVLPVSGTASFPARTVGSQDIKISGFSGTLEGVKEDGTTAPVTITCEAKDPDAVVATVEVTKATVQATATTLKAKYAKKGKKVTVTVKVTKADRSAAQGKVQLVLKKGKKAVGKKTVKLNGKGRAKATFTKVSKKGAYTLTAKYQGDFSAKKSSKKVKLRVR